MDEKAIRGIPWTLVTFGATKVIGVATTVVLARLLSPSDFGLFALATLGTALLSVFNGNWLGAALIVRGDLDERARGTVLTLLIGSGAVLALMLAVVSPLAASAFGQPRLAPILIVFSAILLFSGFNWFYEMVMQRELEFRRRFVTQIGRTVAFSVVALTLGFLGAGVWSLVIAHLVSHIVGGVSLYVLAPYHVRPAFSRTRARKIVGTSRGFLGQELAEFFTQNADYISIGHVLGPTQLGYYSMAYRQAELPHFAVADPLAKVTFPAFARMLQEGRDVAGSFLTAMRLVCLITCPLGIIMSAGAVPFTTALFGDQWLPMTGTLTVLGIWAIIRPLQVTMGRFLNSLGAAWLYGRVSTIALIPFAAGTALAAAHGGIEAVGAVLLGYMLMVAVILLRIIDRHAGISFSRQVRVLWPLVVAGAGSWVATRATADVLAGVQPILQFALTALACLVSYAGALCVLDREVLAVALRHARRLVPAHKAAAATS